MCSTSRQEDDIKDDSTKRENVTSARVQSRDMERLREDEECQARDRWKNIISFCKLAGDSFVDDSFPPSGKSLYYNSQCPTLEPEQAKERHSVTQWLRPHQILAEGDQKIKWTVFRTPLPSDISQGILGNCWLLSALAVLTEREDLVKKILGKYKISHLCKKAFSS